MPCADGLRPVAIDVHTVGEFDRLDRLELGVHAVRRELREVRQRALGDERIDHRPARAVDAEAAPPCARPPARRSRRSEGGEEQEESGAHGGLAEPEHNRPYAPAHASRACHRHLDLARRRPRRLPRPRPAARLRARRARRACGPNTSFPSSRRPPSRTTSRSRRARRVERHGIVANRSSTATKGRFDYANDASWIDAEPLWAAAERQGARAATFFWVGSETPWQGVARDVPEGAVRRERRRSREGRPDPRVARSPARRAPAPRDDVVARRRPRGPPPRARRRRRCAPR